MKYFFLFVICLTASYFGNAQGFKVSLDAPQFEGGIAYLIYYYGKNMNVEDSAEVSANGTAVFKKDQKLLPGVYAVVLPGKRLMYDFLVDKEQDLSVIIDTTDLVHKSTVKGSKENILFQKYQRYAAEQGALLQKELEAYRTATTKQDSLTHQQRYAALNDKLNDYREQLMRDNPNAMLTVLLAAMKEPKVPEQRPVTHEDSVNNYQYFKKHYWDGISFMDSRIIRTPFFLPKVERYFRQVISPAPDSVIKEADYLLLLARSAPEMYKFLLNWLTDEYINPKYMGQDKVLVHLFEKYHSKGISNWLNEKQLEAISNRAYMVMSNLIGEPAANLEMTNAAGVKTPLYNIKAPFTVVVFWDPTCGHCRTEVPRLDSIYEASWKKQGVKMYGVLAETHEKEKWAEFIKEHKLQDWVNVYQTEETRKSIEVANKPSYKQLYDVIQTPTIYLLDKDKRIIAKKLTLEQMDDVLKAKMNSAGTSQ